VALVHGPGHYSPALALAHVSGFAGHVLAAAPAICRLLSTHGLHGGRILDLACGGGQLSRALLARGFEPWGLDVSPAMVALARKRVPGAPFVCADLARADLPQAVAAFAVGEGLNYLTGERALRRVLSRVAQVLPTGGLFVFDLRVLTGATRPGRRLVCSSGEGWALVADVQTDERRRRITRRITTSRLVGGRLRVDHDLHVQRLYGTAKVLAWLAAAGFAARVTRGYGRSRLGASQRVFVAVRRH
jgi:SAM-dependent methyltransferase